LFERQIANVQLASCQNAKLSSSNRWSAAVSRLNEGSQWVYEIKLETATERLPSNSGRVNLYTRNKKSFNSQYPYLVEALRDLPGRYCLLMERWLRLMMQAARNLFAPTVPQPSPAHSVLHL